MPEKHEQDVLESEEPSQRQAMPAILRVALSVLFLSVVALVITWYILWRQLDNNTEAVNAFIAKKPELFAYSTMIVFLLMAIIASITWKVFLSAGIGLSLASILSFINAEKFALRGTPLIPEDFRMAGNVGEVASFVDGGRIARLVTGVILVLIAAILLEVAAKRVWGRNTKELPQWDRHAIVPRFTFSMISIAALLALATPIYHQDDPGWLEGLNLIAWNQTDNYSNNGFIIGFLYNLGRLKIPAPDNYSEATMQQIAERYETKKEEDDTIRKPLNEIATNIIIILDETFYDPELLLDKYPHSGGDVIPNIHKIFQNYPSGYMYSPEYGGNTANIEFEVQTGLSNFWAQTIPYVSSLPKKQQVLSAANWAKQFGFSTTAIHSYNGSVFKRNIVYPILGIDNFIDENTIRHTEREPGDKTNINDKSVFDEIITEIEESDGLQFIAAVTMQNHAPYGSAQYDSHDFQMTGDSGDKYLIENNYQSLHTGDQYLADFLKELGNLKEPTAVLWFGDHLAGLFDEYIHADTQEDRNFAHLTPYFIWTNFQIENTLTAKQVSETNADLGLNLPNKIKSVDLPTTTPNCLQNTFYDLLGAEKPALLYLVAEVCTETPILTPVYLGNDHLMDTQALKDYELVNYDVLGGKHYWYGE